MRGLRQLFLVGFLSGLVGAGQAQPPRQAPVSGLQAGLKGEYFSGTNFEKKLLTRTDPTIAFDWNWQYAAPGVPHEYMSVRWTGHLRAPVTGTYRFSVTADDGVRVWVAGKRIIDEWRKQDDSNFTGTIILRAGQRYDLRVEYYNDWKGSIIYLFWEPPVTTRSAATAYVHPTPIPTQYLSPLPAPKPARLAKPLPAVSARLVVAVKPPVPQRTSRQPVTPVVLPITNTRENRLDVTRPDAARPDAARPDAARPDAARPDAARPDAARPDAARPDVARPDVARPDVARPVADPFAQLSSGQTVVLNHVFFAQSSYTLLPESYAELDKLAQALRKAPTLNLEIAGHTDNVGDARLNQTLSEYRAKIVMSYLIQRGVLEPQLTAKGYGGSRPLTDNNSETHRAQNRRVEIRMR